MFSVKVRWAVCVVFLFCFLFWSAVVLFLELVNVFASVFPIES